MARSLAVGDIRTRRDGAIVLRESSEQYSMTRPGRDLWARYYRALAGAWCVDVWTNDKQEMRAFVGRQAEAEELAAAAVLGLGTDQIWYDLDAIITDKAPKKGQKK